MAQGLKSPSSWKNEEERITKMPEKNTAFNDLVKKNGMKKSALAARCGITPVQFSRYCTGKSPVPLLVQKEIERIAAANS